MLDHVRIVLIEPSGPVNVGAVCRAMYNMGLSDLRVISPRCDLNAPEARGFATHAKHILQNIHVHGDIPSALDGCVATYVTSAKGGMYRRQSVESPRRAATRIAEQRGSGPIAVAFGREDRGILTEELLHFDRLISIPANPEFPVMNLAAAVTLVCYEIRLAALEGAELPDLPQATNQDRAQEGRKRAMYDLLFESLHKVGFFRGQNPQHLHFVLRQIFGKADLTVMEADVLMGVARQLEYYVMKKGALLQGPRAADVESAQSDESESSHSSRGFK